MCVYLRYDGFTTSSFMTEFRLLVFMTENMASGDESLSDSDDDMICCHICLLRFNEIDRKPKFLDCKYILTLFFENQVD